MTFTNNNAWDASMLPHEVIYSAKIGNCVARKIIAKTPNKPVFAATLRHAIANEGPAHALRLAQRLLDLDINEAERLIRRLMRTPATDIVSPHWK